MSLFAIALGEAQADSQAKRHARREHLNDYAMQQYIYDRIVNR